MADFESAVAKTLIQEGGARITNDPNDPGGLTKYGISKRAYPNVDIVNLTEKEAKEIYKRDYWNRVQGNEIKEQSLAENIFDTAVNMGVKTTGRLVQLTLGVQPVDGIIGRQTLKALNQADAEKFLTEFTLTKIARYAHLCNKNKSLSKYLLGWINRALGEAA